MVDPRTLTGRRASFCLIAKLVCGWPKDLANLQQGSLGKGLGMLSLPAHTVPLPLQFATTPRALRVRSAIFLRAVEPCGAWFRCWNRRNVRPGGALDHT